MRYKARIAIVMMLAALLIVAVAPGAASAHERRTVGKYGFIVGFLNEPAYANQMNSLDLSICEGECKSEIKNGVSVLSNPVKDAEKTIKFEVSMGSAAPLALTIAPRYNQPGKYSSYFMPSKVGAYTFRVFGTIGSDKLDEKFTSSPTTFGEAGQLAAYPATEGNAMAATSNTAANYDAQIKEAKDSASSATTFGIIGIVVGVLGLAVAAFALLRRPATSGPTTASTNPAANRG